MHSRDQVSDRPILVIEDDPAIALFLEMVLTTEGYAVVVASDGETALSAVEAQAPALILMDMHLPTRHGGEVHTPGRAGAFLFRALRDRQITAPVVAVTADTRAAETAIAEGVTDTLLKPFDVDDLFAIVTRYTGSPQ
ncbi:MAG: response regulator [Anaerolineae bacterium]|nr:response regulator [Anaerolineae bacterium]